MSTTKGRKVRRPEPAILQRVPITSIDWSGRHRKDMGDL
jgi:hypothetical protein